MKKVNTQTIGVVSVVSMSDIATRAGSGWFEVEGYERMQS